MSNTPESRRAGAVLSIDLDALADNWRLFRDLCAPSKAEAAAVVKACAYGLGVDRAAPALMQAGCKTFFVASIDEAIELRSILGPAPTIHVFYGLMEGAERDFVEFDLIPVLNTLGEVGAWRAFCLGFGKSLPCDLHIDTGMSRLGLDDQELTSLVDNPDQLDGLNLNMAMSHLASAEEADNPSNAQQLGKFQAALKHINPTHASLANSSGTFLGPDYHFDLVRPGIALYGSNPTPDQPNPMAQVIRLQAKVLQVRTIDTRQGVGYGSTYQAVPGARLATIAAGYADGYPRRLSNTGDVYFGEFRAPVVGRVSMDLLTVDVSQVPEPLCRPGQLADLIGPLNSIDDVADKAATIGYELLTQLGSRYHRVYAQVNTGGIQTS